MNQFFLVFLGGGLGSIVRYAIGIATPRFSQTQIPIHTLLANGVSCIIMGLFFMFISKNENLASYRNLLLVGVCGGLSTFSTFSFEILEFIKTGNIFSALLYIIISIMMCVGILYVFVK